MTRDEILSMAREAGLLTVTVSKAVGEIRKDRIVNFANVVTATERAARIEAQRLLADAQELAAKSGLAHRKAVQEAVREALQEAKKACENLPAPEACTGVERSLWDVATMACAEAVGKLNGGNNAI